MPLREPGSRLSHDAIDDANSYMLAAAVRQAGAIAYRVGITSDDPADFADALSDQLVRADLVVTSGGVSKGEYDVVKAVLSERGTVWFGGVRMQPGKPQGFGRVGEDGTPIFALPGDPVSAYVSCSCSCCPALRRLMGRTPYRRLPSRARLTAPMRSALGKEQYARAGALLRQLRAGAWSGSGGTRYAPARGPVGRGNALIVVPEDVDHLAEGRAGRRAAADRDY